jgi:type IV pilus assembly protein PilB
MVHFDDATQDKKLDEIRKREEEDLAEMLSQKYGVGYLDLSTMSINVDSLRILTEEEARKANMAVFGGAGKKIQVAVLAPANPETETVLEDLRRKEYLPEVFMVSRPSLDRALERYKDLSLAMETKEGVLDISNEEIQRIAGETKTLVDVRKIIAETLALKRAYRISRIVEIILSGALGTGASDVHIEPEEDSVRIRFRLNGVLTEVASFDHETYNLLLSRLKLLSNLKLNVKETSQDGRFSIKFGDADIEIRSSTLPGAYGESVVMRILNPETISVPMEALGMEPELLAVLEREIAKPSGLILNTGPTGSGKTTTLYAFLKKIHSPDIKIITIEDPIEYHVAGIVQSQVDREKEYTFAAGLRSALRQDPDIIMVGEIRDGETAEIAVNSALTGHLVFSTLHTNNAAGAFPRLIDLGANPKVLSSAVTVTMAQRLVRKLCEKCKREVQANETDAALIIRLLANIKKTTKPSFTGSVFEPVGCETCSGTGYKGRIGVFEVILMDQTVEEVIAQYPSEREIAKAATHQDIPSLAEDAAMKIARGLTSFEEVRRVLDIDAVAAEPAPGAAVAETPGSV